MNYTDLVIDYLEYIGYPVMIYHPEDVARAINRCADIFEHAGLSHRLCALSIFDLTWKYQISKVSGTIQ